MATATLEVDTRELPAVKLFVWEMIELRDRLAARGEHVEAMAIDDAVRRLSRGNEST